MRIKGNARLGLGVCITIGLRMAGGRSLNEDPADCQPKGVGALERGEFQAGVLVSKSAPGAEVTISAEHLFEHASLNRGLKFSWCVESFIPALEPKTLGPTLAPTNRPSDQSPTMQPTTVTGLCPNTRYNNTRCVPFDVDRATCLQLGCCFDPMNKNSTHFIDCYPVNLSGNGRRRELSGEKILNLESGNQSRRLEAGLPPRCSDGQDETRTAKLELSNIIGVGTYRIRVTVSDAKCKQFQDLQDTVEVNTERTVQCPSYHAHPPGDVSSCYCADSSMRDEACPTCSVMKNACPEGYIHDLKHDTCVYDSQVCLEERDSIVERINSPWDRNVIDELHPAFPNECTGYSSWAPTHFPTFSPTLYPTLSPTTPVPSLSPTDPPNTPNPTLSPIRQVCTIYPELGGKWGKQEECEIPFTYKSGSQEKVFDYPPLFSEAVPHALEDFPQLDPESKIQRWCPPLGTKTYDPNSRPPHRGKWGVARCTDSGALPSVSPTSAPTNSPTTEHPTTLSPTPSPTRRYGCFIPAGTPGFRQGQAGECQLPFTYKGPSQVPLVFDQPPTLKEAPPFGLSGFPELDPDDTLIRWCPELGVTTYNTEIPSINQKWGVSTCTEALPTHSPTPKPSHAPIMSDTPTNAPTTREPTSPPTRAFGCYISGNEGYITEESDCQLPFQFEDRYGQVWSYDYPPNFNEATPYGVNALGKKYDEKDTMMRWCPPKGQSFYSFLEIGQRKKWGIVTCDSNGGLPTPSPTEKPTGSPVTGIPSKMPTKKPTRVGNCFIPNHSKGYIKEETDCQLPFKYANGPGGTRVYEYPPNVVEAIPWGLEKKPDIDPNDRNARWCPPLGEAVYNYGKKGNRVLWGTVECDAPEELPTVQPTGAPSPSPTTAAPVTGAPSLAPTSKYGCFIPTDLKGWENQKDSKWCQIPFTFVDTDGTTTEYNYAPLFTEAKPFGTEKLGINIYAGDRWCPASGVEEYKIRESKIKKRWGTARCVNPDAVPSAAPTLKFGGKPSNVGWPKNGWGCVSPCKVGYVFNANRRKCVPLVNPTCHDGHYYNQSTCSVRRCGFENGKPLEVNVTYNIDAAKKEIRVLLRPNVELQDIDSSLFIFDEMPRGQDVRLVAQHDQENRDRSGTHLGHGHSERELLFEVAGAATKLLPNGRYVGSANVRDKCGRDAIVIPETLYLTVPNKAPVLLVSAKYFWASEPDAPIHVPVEQKQDDDDDIKVVTVKQETIDLAHPIVIELDARESYDPDEFHVTDFVWRVISEGDQNDEGTTRGSAWSHEFKTYGSVTVELSVTDEHGGVSTQQFLVQVKANVAPVADASASSLTVGFGSLSQIRLDAGNSWDDEKVTGFSWEYMYSTPLPDQNRPLSQRVLDILARHGVPGFENPSQSPNPVLQKWHPIIQDPKAATTFVTGLVPGVHRFSLTVYDAQMLASNTTAIDVAVFSRFEDSTLPNQVLEPVESSTWARSVAENVRFNAFDTIDPALATISCRLVNADSKEWSELIAPVEKASPALSYEREYTTSSSVPAPGTYYLEFHFHFQSQANSTGKHRESSLADVHLPFVRRSETFAIRPSVAFSLGQWSVCEGQPCSPSALYFSGRQVRTVRCISVPDGQELELAVCARRLQQHVPVSTKECRSTCGVQHATLSISPWSACTESSSNQPCVFKQTRSVECQSAITGSPLDSDACSTITQNGAFPVGLVRPCAMAGSSCTDAFEVVSHVHRGSATQDKCVCRSPSQGLPVVTHKICRNKYSGELAAPSICGSSEVSLSIERQECNPPAECDHMVWLASAWSRCPAACATGETSATRSVVCYDLLLQKEQPEAYCAHLPGTKPSTERSCNQEKPCTIHSWWVSPWSTCSKSECNCDRSLCGEMTRIVKCMKIDRATGIESEEPDETLCQGSSGMSRPSEKSDCGSLPASCPSQGTPMTDCTRDKLGQCCPEGQIVNACGVCSAPGSVEAQAKVDALGDCCEHGVLDAEGFCCSKGRLDSCGVCDGTGESCSQVVILPFAADPELFDRIHTKRDHMEIFVLLENARALLGGSAPSFKLKLLGIEPLERSGGRVLSSGDNAKAQLTLSGDGQQRGQIESALLQVANTSSPLSPGHRIGVCGNGICEVGEACSTSDVSETSCCPKDCHTSANSCPVDARSGQPCSGRGTCLAYAGECECWAHYQGHDCSDCNTGWVHDGSGSCVPLQPSSLPTPPPVGSLQGASPDSSTKNEWWPFLLIPVAFILGCVGVWLYMRRSSQRYVSKRPKVFVGGRETPSNIKDSQFPPVPPKSWEIPPDLPPRPPPAGAAAAGPTYNSPPGVHQEGWLKMRVTGEDGVSSWDTLYFVLYKEKRHLTYYIGMTKSSEYNVYTGELGAIALDGLASVRTADDKHFQNRAFELMLRRPDGEGMTTHLFMCESVSMRQTWVDALSYYVVIPRKVSYDNTNSSQKWKRYPDDVPVQSSSSRSLLRSGDSSPRRPGLARMNSQTAPLPPGERDITMS